MKIFIYFCIHLSFLYVRETKCFFFKLENLFIEYEDFITYNNLEPKFLIIYWN